MGKSKQLAAPGRVPPPAGARDLAKQELARHLVAAMRERDWSQSDLARHADVPRELISTYVRGVSLPEPRTLRKLANALNTKPETLLPATQGMTAQDEIPAFAISEFAGHPGKVWLRINQMVPTSIALRIGALLQEGAGHV
jgi:transcriptional regulator with XRE-family HTH domain